MIKRLVILTTAVLLLSGCFMAPLVLIGPASSGFTTASIIQSGVTSTANYMVKRRTGKTITEHAFNAITKDAFKQTYFPDVKVITLIVPKSKPIE